MVNWKDIDINFTTELRKEWESKGFSYEECKEWINIGLSPKEADFANWLVKSKGGDYANPEWVLNNGNKKVLTK